MASQSNLVLITKPASADYSAVANQYLLGAVNSSGNFVVASAAGQTVVGTLQNKPQSGEAASIAIFGITKVKAGAAFAIGTLLKSSAAGKAVTASKGVTDTSDSGAASDPLIGSYVIGIALEAAGAENDIVSMLITHSGAVATTAA